ncbi:zinc finger MYM-type protein 3 isoform X1 [Condylostylus longicornis]|uniref:zinc finger MYM-type protein 3 isoform X1 n=1 Tax=Condylostylus longicornis TaxID=2530218 RepID=UPI00244E58AC|nr:zinc finger MYM-type protein 3 isoform X1 [Condylostylus longicornis]XP_055387778.1 zinc finger MYM-type protein 3 isoform X1 [Condylostylus longicornis]
MDEANEQNLTSIASDKNQHQDEDKEKSDANKSELEYEEISNTSESNKNEEEENRDEGEEEEESGNVGENEEGETGNVRENEDEGITNVRENDEEENDNGGENDEEETDNIGENYEGKENIHEEVESQDNESKRDNEEVDTSLHLEKDDNYNLEKDATEGNDGNTDEQDEENKDNENSIASDHDSQEENEKEQADVENENDENLTKNDQENSRPDIEEVDAEISLSKTNQEDEEDVLSDDRTQTTEKVKSNEQSQMDVDSEEPAASRVERNDDIFDETSKENEGQDIEMTDISQKEKPKEKDKFDELFESTRKSTNVQSMDTEEYEKDNESQQESEAEPLAESRDEPDTTLQTESAENAENESEITETQTENVQEEEQGESADVCLIPDNDEELTGAEKEQAILARQNAEKEDAEKEEAESEATRTTTEHGKDAQVQLVETQDEVIIEDDENKASNEASKSQEAALSKTIISLVVGTDQTCSQCNQNKNCEYRLKDNETGEYIYICEQECIDKIMGENNDKYLLRKRKFMIEDLSEEKVENCLVCQTEKTCSFYFKQDEDSLFICSTECFKSLDSKEPDKLRMKRNSIRVKNLGGVSMSQSETPADLKIVARTAHEAELAKLERETSFMRRCVGCNQELQFSRNNLKWQTLDFCNQLCLSKYQQMIGCKCRMCFGPVSHPSLGKYCVRFGFEICQFCCATCLDKYKKSLKNCSYCQKDISKTSEGFLAPVGDNEQFKDFCSQNCMKKYDILTNPKKKIRNEQCSVCNNKKVAYVDLFIDGREINFCSNPCFSAFKFVNNVAPDKCNLCSKYFERKSTEHFTIYEDSIAKIFCNKICFNMYITRNRKIVFCQWCKVKKYNFDMIERAPNELSDGVIMCSLNCLVLYEVSLNRITKQKMKCDNCLMEKTPQYHLTMSDSSMRNFCTYQCVMQFQSQFSTTPLTLENEPSSLTQNKSGTYDSQSPFPTGLPKRIKASQSAVQTLHISPKQPTMPVISNITSLANEAQRKPNKRPSNGSQARQQSRGYSTNRLTSQTVATLSVQSTLHDFSPLPTYKNSVGTMTTETNVKTTIITIPPVPPKISNKRIMCKPVTETKGITCKPLSFNTGVQTDEDMTAKILIPIPVPIYVPQPLHMYSLPFPVPVPVPLPIPIPIFIPTTRNSANGILKEIKKIHDKMPSDPFEAELLMMAEMVAGDNKKEESDSDDEDEAPGLPTENYNNDEIVTTNNAYGEDVLQMALKMATEYDEPAVDLESAMTASTITQPPPGTQPAPEEMEEDDQSMLYQMAIQTTPGTRGRGRKRTNTPRGGGAKRGRRNDSTLHQPVETVPVQASQPIVPVEKPDANMCLKYTFGVNAWKQWVMTKNAELEKSPVRRKPFKSELMQMTADELNYSLCLFVKEVRKPNGTEYAPDTIYYLVLGIQQYLYENGRIDNIFTDPYYERFTDCLDEVARKFSVLYNDSQYIVTRVEEEHLWECKQLGAHSPHVLLSTLMFFNTKHFNLTTVEEHMQLSFSHIMKHWKRSPQGTKQPGSRNVLLRFYPPQAAQDSRKKKVYEQQENEANPLRCPVRLYEFYLSKCPESVKTRNDVFYLQPERSCVPDSPVWYSTQPLTQDSLQKMLHRVKMVKEINVAILNI